MIWEFNYEELQYISKALNGFNLRFLIKQWIENLYFNIIKKDISKVSNI
jgi:hypothetical protein